MNKGTEIFIFAVGGIFTVADMREVLLVGAEKISVNSGAVKTPHILSERAVAFGSQCTVVGMGVLRVPVSKEIPSGYEIVIYGAHKQMVIDALCWARANCA